MKRMFAVLVLGLGVMLTLPLVSRRQRPWVEAVTAIEYIRAGAQRDGQADLVEPSLAELH